MICKLFKNFCWWTLEELLIRGLMVCCLLAMGSIMLFVGIEILPPDLLFRPDYLWIGGSIPFFYAAYKVAKDSLY